MNALVVWETKAAACCSGVGTGVTGRGGVGTGGSGAAGTGGGVAGGSDVLNGRGMTVGRPEVLKLPAGEGLGVAGRGSGELLTPGEGDVMLLAPGSTHVAPQAPHTSSTHTVPARHRRRGQEGTHSSGGVPSGHTPACASNTGLGLVGTGAIMDGSSSRTQSATHPPSGLKGQWLIWQVEPGSQLIVVHGETPQMARGLPSGHRPPSPSFSVCAVTILLHNNAARPKASRPRIRNAAWLGLPLSDTNAPTRNPRLCALNFTHVVQMV